MGDLENEGNAGNEGDQGAGNENEPGEFFSSLSEEYQADATIQNFKTADHDTVAKTIINQQKLAGEKGVRLPKEGDAEDMARFNAEIGGISDPTKFELPEISKDESEAIKYSQEAWKELSANLGLRPDQCLKGQEEILENSRNMVAQAKAKADEAFGIADKEVRAEMGADYDGNMDKVERLISGNASSEEGGKRLFEAVKKDPEAFQALSRVAGLLSENTIGKINPISEGKSPEQAQARINEIMADPNYMESDDPDVRDPLIAEMNDLDRVLKRANG